MSKEIERHHVKKVYEQDAQEMLSNQTVKLRMTNLHLFGTGVFSNVYRGTLLCKEGNKEIAIKKTWPDQTRERNFEVNFLMGLDRRSHKNVVQMTYSFTNKHKDEKICEAFVFDFMPDTLHSAIRHKDLDQLDIRLYCWQVFSGIHYLSTLDIIHRDLKPVNILVDHPKGLLKIADFGASKIAKEGKNSTPYQVTRYYRPPELLLNSKRYDCTVDIWSAGCCFGEMLRCKTLLPGKDSQNQLQLIINELGVPSADDLKAMQAEASFDGESKKPRKFHTLCYKVAGEWPEALILLQRVLVFKPKERYNGLALLNDPFFAELFVPGKARSNGQLISTIIERNDIKLAENDERQMHTRRVKINEAKKEEKTSKGSQTSIIKLQPSRSGSDESAHLRNKKMRPRQLSSETQTTQKASAVNMKSLNRN